MAQIRPTFRHYLIVMVGLVPTFLAAIFGNQVAATIGLPPKIVFFVAFVASLALILGLSILSDRKAIRSKPPWILRAISAATIVVAVTYFFMREEIADALKVPLKIGDFAMMTLAAIPASLVIRHYGRESSQDLGDHG